MGWAWSGAGPPLIAGVEKVIDRRRRTVVRVATAGFSLAFEQFI
jgi:hypothetical protein